MQLIFFFSFVYSTINTVPQVILTTVFPFFSFSFYYYLFIIIIYISFFFINFFFLLQKAPYVYKAPGENLNVGLKNELRTILNVQGFRQVNDLNAFVNDRASHRQGCNLLLIKKNSKDSQK